MIQVIAFDFGGTLFSTSGMGRFTPELRKTFADSTIVNLGCAPDFAQAAFDRYVEAWKERRAKSTSLPERETSSAQLLSEALSSLGAQAEHSQILAILNAFHTKESELFMPLPSVVQAVTDLAQNGYRLCIVSNNPWSESIHASLRRFEIDGHFEDVIVSCDIGYRKPHRKIFDELLVRVNTRPSQILFVGDSFFHDIETPMALGLRTCLVDFEGLNKNSQKEHAHKADFFLTHFAELRPILDRS